MLNLDNNVLNGGGAISLQSGETFPNGQVYGRFFNNTDDNTLYFDNGNDWFAINGGGFVPDLNAVLGAGNTAYNKQMNLQGNNANLTIISDNQNTPLLNLLSVNIYNNYSNGVYGIGYGYGTYNGAYINMQDSASNTTLQLADVTQNYFEFSFLASANGTLNIDPIQPQQIMSNTTFRYFFNVQNVNSQINNNIISCNILIDSDAVGKDLTSTMDFNAERIGLFVKFLKSANSNYNDYVYGIWDQGNDIRFDGFLMVKSSSNPVPSVTSATFGKPINYENSTTNSAGANSGKYLIVYDNGTPYKIALLNN